MRSYVAFSRDYSRSAVETMLAEAIRTADLFEQEASDLQIASLKESGAALKIASAASDLAGCHARHWRRCVDVLKLLRDELEP